MKQSSRGGGGECGARFLGSVPGPVVCGEENWRINPDTLFFIEGILINCLTRIRQAPKVLVSVIHRHLKPSHPSFLSIARKSWAWKVMPEEGCLCDFMFDCSVLSA